MIALDTNVVVGLLVDDDPEQTRRARKLIEEFATFDARLAKRARRITARGISVP